LTEGLLCLTAGLLVVAVFGLPTLTKLSVAVCAGVSIVCAVIAKGLYFKLEIDKYIRLFTNHEESNISYPERYDEDLRSSRDTIFFFLLFIVCLIVFSLLTSHSHVTFLLSVSFFYGVYQIMSAFTSEPPDLQHRLHTGTLIVLVSAGLLLLWLILCKI